MKFASVSSEEIALHLGLSHAGETVQVSRVSPVDEPEQGALSFCIDPSSDALSKWSNFVGAMIAPENASIPRSCSHIISKNPRADYAIAVRTFFASSREVGVATSSFIDASAEIGLDVFIGQNAVIEANVRIGARTTIGHNSTILRGSVIGDDVTIGHNTVVGSVGFGLEEDENGDWIRIPHLGNVVIEDNVEIGSSSVIARGTIKETRIGQNCKIDDNVFIAHNVQIARNVVVIANAEVSGSVRIGENCWIGPAVTVLEKVNIGAHSMIGLGSVVIRDVEPGTVVVGNPGKMLRNR